MNKSIWCFGAAVVCILAGCESDDWKQPVSPDLACCGDACINCSGGAGWKSGECKAGKCVSEQCKDGYQLSPKPDGSVVCAPKSGAPSENPCSGKSCPVGQECSTETGMCVCSPGFALCGDGCFDLMNNDDHCGRCDTVCGNIAHGSTYCDAGVCKANCSDGYMPSDDERSCVVDDGSCKKGDVRCGDDAEGNITVSTCNEKKEWEITKTCYLGKGFSGAYCGSDCGVHCKDEYTQNEDKSACVLKSSPCTNGEKRCNDNGRRIEYLICRDNKWDVIKSCKYENSWMLQCSPETGCEFECLKGYELNSEGTQCVFDSESTCTDGATRCGGTEVHKCINNHWKVVEVCNLQGKHGGSVHCDDSTGCHYGCYGGNVLCGVNTCADLKNDADHCGSCDNVCKSGKCVNGVCQ